ncbi:N-acetyltransferase [Agarivorans litoreus]|uniref:N-acetyltransferase n=1 Tax=Agarivorans litoreus TaxID=1510455 RepID=UPI001C7CD23D|nr:N-acetyltransferase [Agarivorans litoreus]
MDIHPTAIISPKATLGNNVTVGPFSIVHDNVEIADNVVIESHCELGVRNQRTGDKPLVVGSNSHIRSHSVLYAASSFGSNFVTGHRVTIRENTSAGKNFQVGTLGDIQGDCVIGDYVRFHSNVHIGQHSIVGNFVWIFPYVVLTNDPHPPSNVMQGVTVEDFAVIATMSVILPGVKIAGGCLVAAHSSVNRNTKANTIYAGSPAKAVGETSKIRLKDGSRRPAYPWPKHFKRGYPEEAIKILESIASDNA